MKPLLRIYVLAVIAAGVAAIGLGLLFAPLQASRHDSILITLLVTLAALTYLAPVKLAAKRVLVLHAALQTVALLTLPPGLAAAGMAVGVLTGNLYLRRRWFNSLFNAAQVALATSAAGIVYGQLAPVSLAQPGRDLRSLIAVVPAGIVLFAISSLASDTAAAIQRGRSPFRDWLELHAPEVASHVALVAIGAATATTIYRAPWLMLVAVAPIAAIRASLNAALGFDDETIGIVEEVVDAAETRHPYLAGSSGRVAETAAQIARARGLPEIDCRRIRLAAHLHDVAMALLPDFIELAGRGACDEHERFFWSTHCEVGADLVSRVLRLPAVAEAIEYHHERMDGRGYPHGLRGHDIPLDARIVAVAEAWVALRSERGYRPALGEEQALGVLHAGAGEQWDAGLVETLTTLIRPEARSRVRTAATRGLAATFLSTRT